MKRPVLATVLFLLCLATFVQAGDRVVERPPIVGRSSDILEIEKIVVSDTATTIFVRAYHQPGKSIKIATGSCLKDSNDTLYPIRSGIGITLDKEFRLPASGEGSFQLVFPPVPGTVQVLDFLEGDFEGAYKLWGIRLDEKDFRKRPLPKTTGRHKASREAELPTPAIGYGVATLRGRVLDFEPGMPANGSLLLNDPVRGMDYHKDIRLDADGCFGADMEVITVTPAIIHFPFVTLPCLLVPGKECRVVVNPAEWTRRRSHLLKNQKPYGKLAYFEGELATLQQELAENTLSCNLVAQPGEMLKDMLGKDLGGIKDYLTTKHCDLYRQIEATPYSTATQQVMKANADITMAIGLLMGQSMVMRTSGKHEPSEYPADYFEGVKTLTLNAPAALYASEYAYGINIFAPQLPLLTKVLGTDRGILFDMAKAHLCVRPLQEELTPLTAAQKATLDTLPAAYKQLVYSLNEQLLEQIALNKQKNGYSVHEVGKDVTNECLFDSIIAPFKEHVLLVDFWATWCGPCKMANREMLPLKEELKDKDILYLYVTGETSPESTWENLIPDLHGEHFRLTNDQWTYLMKSFGIQGIPTYFIIDREGNITYRHTGFPGRETIKNLLLHTLAAEVK